MFFHIILTTDCNLQCKYCFGESLDDFDEDFDHFDLDYALPKKLNYDIQTLAKFCKQDPECVLTFYGGEPLVNRDALRKIMDKVPAKYFMMQTNGLLLDKLESEYVNRFNTLLVSIDGEERLTDFYRGAGTFRKVVDNLKLITDNGFKGEVIARVTVMEQTDIFRQITWLLENNEFSFSSVHWQLNAGFWGNDYKRRNFKQWSETSYMLGVEKLAQFWVDRMIANGSVLKLYPLLGIANSLLHGNEPSLLRCGGGWVNYAVQTDGYIIPCPTMWGMKKYYLGHIKETDPLQLNQILISDPPCANCSVLQVCGGRCLYANITKRWSDQEYTEVCNTVKGLIGSVQRQIPRIQRLLSEGKITLADLDYLRYNGCEVIP